MPQMNVPGTVIPYSGDGGMFSVFRPMIKATGGLSLGQVCSVTGLEYSTVQNWVKRGYVAHPIQKKYYERQLARILLISALRDCMKIEDIGDLMAMVNGSADDESDDIISEETMYDYLCEAIRSIEDVIPDEEEVAKLVQNVIADYNAPDEEARVRLTLALTVMVYAHLSARLKNKAEENLTKLKNMHLRRENELRGKGI